MFGWLRRIAAAPVKAGAKWTLKDSSDNPFREKATATVVAVQDGWVQYTFGGPHWSLDAVTFRAIYRQGVD